MPLSALGALLAAALLLLPLSCGGAAQPLMPGELLILDKDAGTPIAGEGDARRGALFRVSKQQDGSFAAPVLYATDDRWVEPVDVLLLPDGDALVLEQQWSNEAAPAPRVALARDRRARVLVEDEQLARHQRLGGAAAG
ncbi:MAG TPA: hypothetical protein VFF36_09025, partial [Planctomycetota bacterium]|nr:hypothetical protein [Planctomycetota bacterium]